MSKVWTPHLLIAWGGTLGTPSQDVWTNTLKGLPVDAEGVQVPFTEDEQNEWLALAEPVISEWVSQNTPAATHTNTVNLEWIKANMIASTGKYMYANTSVLDVSPVVHGAASTPHDWRQSLVVTLRTDKARGRAHAGRFYPPVTPYEPENSSTPYIASTVATNFLNIAANFTGSLNGLTTASGKSALISIFSPGETAIGLEPAYNGVTGWEVDRVLDTQRRRTNRVPRLVVTL